MRAIHLLYSNCMVFIAEICVFEKEILKDISLPQDEDDRFGFQVEVQAADHALNTEDKENILHVALR